MDFVHFLDGKCESIVEVHLPAQTHAHTYKHAHTRAPRTSRSNLDNVIGRYLKSHLMLYYKTNAKTTLLFILYLNP